MLSSFYCRSAGAAVLAYDVTDRQTFLDLDKFLKILRDGGAQPDCFLVLTGTKLDLVQKKLRERAVSEEEAQTYASNLGAAYIETRYASLRLALGINAACGSQCCAPCFYSRVTAQSPATTSPNSLT